MRLTFRPHLDDASRQSVIVLDVPGTLTRVQDGQTVELSFVKVGVVRAQACVLSGIPDPLCPSADDLPRPRWIIHNGDASLNQNVSNRVATRLCGLLVAVGDFQGKCLRQF